MSEQPLRALSRSWEMQLKQAEVFAPGFELSELLTAALGWNRTEQARHADQPLLPHQRQAVEKLLASRLAGEPLQYLLGEWEFYGLTLSVGSGVLIPRADTETLVETGLQLCKGIAAPKIVDLCSGSGCVALALAQHCPAATVTAVELSDDAFCYLQRNVARYPHAQVQALQADVLAAAPRLQGLDLLVSNPPYIPTEELPSLQREVQREPKLALDGGTDGLDFYHTIATRYKQSLLPGGWIAFEVGDNQAAAVCSILADNGYKQPATRHDLQGFARVVYAQR